MDGDRGAHWIRGDYLLHLLFVRRGVVAEAQSCARVGLAFYGEFVGDTRCVGETVSALSGGGSTFLSLFLEL